MTGEMQFIKTESLRIEPTGKKGDGQAEFAVTLRCTLKWWRPSYWAWLAWPMTIWFALRYGPFVKSEAST